LAAGVAGVADRFELTACFIGRPVIRRPPAPFLHDAVTRSLVVLLVLCARQHLATMYTISTLTITPMPTN